MKEFQMTDDLSKIGESIRGRLTSSEPSARWRILGELGVTGLRVPEQFGGLGLSVKEVGPIFDALGELCAQTPYLDVAVVAAGLLQAERSTPADDLLKAIAVENMRIAVAGIDRRLRGGVSATPTANAWRLDGDAKLVIDDGDAPWLIVAARTESYDTALLLLRRDMVGVTGHSYPTIDGRRATDFRFIGAEATLLCSDADEALVAASDEAIVCLSIEAAALMRRLVADTVAFTKQRKQFGQPIARFQVLQHRLVDMHIQARRAGAIARRALAALDGDRRERGRLASAAKATVAETGRFVGQQAVQLHGGMGMTEELPISRYFKRMTVIEGELGNRDDHLRRFAELAT